MPPGRFERREIPVYTPLIFWRVEKKLIKIKLMSNFLKTPLKRKELMFPKFYI